MIQLNYIAVDDEPIFLKELNEHLLAYPFLNKLDLISDPFEAIDIINTQKPDVVFLDHDMPGINGRDVLKAINFKTQIVFITSNFSPIQDVINHGGIATIQGYISKPISEEKIKDICLKLNKADSNHITKTKLTVPNGKKEDYYIEFSKLSYIEAEGKYSNWHLLDAPTIKNIALSLKESRELLLSNKIDFKELNRSSIIFENGIKKRRNKDIIVTSNGKDVVIGTKDIDGFFSWLKRKLR
ncbi:MAG: response regulator [Labilibaculum sp.]|nr:response regulator [Labilibaculum sp.]MBI9058286.1 response regulator [Labilibaculum sp.]